MIEEVVSKDLLAHAKGDVLVAGNFIGNFREARADLNESFAAAG